MLVLGSGQTLSFLVIPRKIIQVGVLAVNDQGFEPLSVGNHGGAVTSRTGGEVGSKKLVGAPIVPRIIWKTISLCFMGIQLAPSDLDFSILLLVQIDRTSRDMRLLICITTAIAGRTSRDMFLLNPNLVQYSAKQGRINLISKWKSQETPPSWAGRLVASKLAPTGSWKQHCFCK